MPRQMTINLICFHFVKVHNSINRFCHKKQFNRSQNLEENFAFSGQATVNQSGTNNHALLITKMNPVSANQNSVILPCM